MAEPPLRGPVGNAVAAAIALLFLSFSVYGLVSFLPDRYRAKVDRYEVRGIEVVCYRGTEEWCPEPEDFRDFLDDVFDPFYELSLYDGDPYMAIEGIQYVVEAQPFTHPHAALTDIDCPDFEGEQVRVEGTPCFAFGLTHPGDRSRVYGPYSMQVSTGGHELRLHLLEVMFPGQSERDDIVFLRDSGVYAVDADRRR